MDGLRFILRDPAPHLGPYVLSLMGYSERTLAPVIRDELPAAMVVVIIELGPPIAVGGERYQGGFIAGLGEAPTHRA